MIDPQNIINYDRTEAELQELIMFLLVTAGKKATTSARLLNEFLMKPEPVMPDSTPFQKILQLDDRDRTLDDGTFENMLEFRIKTSSLGQYTRLTRAFRELAHSGLDLKTCSLQDLMGIFGIGRKSASCFLMWTRKGQRVSGLDVHLLAELRELGYDAPLSTPSSLKVYDRLESIVLELADESGLSPEAWDLQVWKRRTDRQRSQSA